MKYAEIVDLYGRLEATTKKLEKAALLADFYKKCSGELYQCVVLSMGQVFPRGNEELGVASELIKRVIARVAGVSGGEVVEAFKTTGDLGLAAEKLLSQRKQIVLAKKELTAEKVFENLRRLPAVSGSGSQERKIDVIAELLAAATGEEAKYIVRTALGQMRVGVAAGIVRDAIAKAFNMDAKEIEHAYNMIGDYGVVAERARKGKVAAAIEIFTPINLMLAERGGDDLKAAFETFENVAIETKYDGFRCITGNAAVYTNPHGLKSIKDIRPGDKVLTHKGRFKKVIAVNKRKIKKHEKLYRLQSYMGDEFKISKGHKMLCSRNKNIIWLPPEKVEKDDMLVFPLPKLQKSPLAKAMLLDDESGYKKKIVLDENFFRFLGYWIGDGFTNEFHNTERVGMIFNSNDTKLMKEYEKIIKNVFGIQHIAEYKHNSNAITIYWRDKPLRIWLSKNFRMAWHGKTLPWWFTDVSPSNFKAFLRGWSESDGHKTNRGTISITTKEKRLATLAQMIGLMHGMAIGLKRIMVQMPRKNYKKEYYKIVIPSSSKYARCNGRNALFRILKKEEVKRPDPRTNLYNLQVKDDESYCVNNIALHNCQIHKKDNEVKIFSRRLEDVTNQFPDIAQWAKSQVRAKSVILDGEAVAYDAARKKPLAFQQLSRRIQRKYDIDKMVREIPIQVNLFDIIYLDGKTLMGAALTERWAALKKIIKPTESFRTADHIETKDAKAAKKFFLSALAEGQEGVIVKNLDAKYRPGRRVGYWLKIKKILEPLDLVIVGAEWGEGKRSKWLSSMILAARDGSALKETGRMASGFTEAQLEELTKKLRTLVEKEDGKIVAVRPQVVVEIGYEEIQKSPKYPSGYALRFPRLLRIRTDKGPKDADTVKTIERLYKMQRGRKK